MFKVNNKGSTVFIVNFELVSYLFTPDSSIFIVGFDAAWSHPINL